MRILVHLQPQFPETVEGEFFKFSEKPQHYHLYLMVDVERREEK